MNPINPQSKVWFVTGTSSGFGRSIVEELIDRGERAVATARDPRTLADLVERAPGQVLALRLDVTKPQEIQSAVAAAIGHFGVVDVLVNNAGYSVVGALEETSETELRALFEPMFFGAVAMTQAMLPQMRERRAGTIVQITSVGGVVTAPGFGPYCAAKPRWKRSLKLRPPKFRRSVCGC
jgi:NAD(P)-dependent dehydrogenase (short-subunit alcohol dehydrogenase family)